MKHRVSSLFEGPSRSESYAIRCLVPDLPATSDLVPYLERIERNRWHSNFGPLLFEYEQRLSDIVGGACVTTSSGTTALELGIAALGLSPGSRVLLPAYTFPAPLLAVQRCGLTPVMCDVCPDAWTLTPEIAAAALEHVDAKLVVPVATFGRPLCTDAWERFAAETGVHVVIDAAPALGRQTVGQRVHAAYSLHATKPLGIGEGGVFATADADLAESVRRYTNYGMSQGVVTRGGGTNAKLSEYAAAVGHAQLDRWDALVERRTAIWRSYREALEAIPDLVVQAGLEAFPPALLCVRVPADAVCVAAELSAAGVETRRWYLPPLYEHPPFRGLETVGPDGEKSLPATAGAAAHHLGLPFHTRLSDVDIGVVGRPLQAACAAA